MRQLYLICLPQELRERPDVEGEGVVQRANWRIEGALYECMQREFGEHSIYRSTPATTMHAVDK